LQEHRAIQKKAAEVADPEEREALMLTSSVYAGSKKVSFVFALFKRPPRVLEYAVGYAWRCTNGFDTISF
jgi:hypothetical protein